jgi:dihydrofolate reductase
MGKIKVAAFSVSLDGFGAGPEQSLENPIGKRGHDLHKWMLKTKMFHDMIGKPGGATDVDNDFAMESMQHNGAWIMGRNMFGPIRGAWPNEDWKGWWGPNPPYHVPVYVLTHHARKPLEMEGGNVFHFVTDGIESALKQAKKAAGNKDIRIGGGVSTIRQFLQAGMIDEMHLAFSPVILGEGEALLTGIDLQRLGFKVAGHKNTEAAMHVRFTK